MLFFKLLEIRFQNMIMERCYSYPLTAIIFLKCHKYECMNIHKKKTRVRKNDIYKNYGMQVQQFFILSRPLSISLTISLFLFHAFNYFQYSIGNIFMKRIALSNWRETHPFLTILENIFNHAFCTTCGFYSESYRRCVNVCIQTFAFKRRELK